MFGVTKSGFAVQVAATPPTARQAASVVQATPASCEQVPGAKLARPRRSMVLRRLELNWEKSQVRPSWPPKSGWQELHAREPPSRAVLTTWPWTWTIEPSVASPFHGGTGEFFPCASRAAVE